MSDDKKRERRKGPPPGYHERDATVEDYMELFDIDRDAAISLWNDQRQEAIEEGVPFDKIWEPNAPKK